MNENKEKIINEYLDNRISIMIKNVGDSEKPFNKICYEAILSELQSVKELMKV